MYIQLVEAFTQSEAVIEPHKGGVFSLMGGQISGEFLECVRPSKIVQKWRLKTWPDGKWHTYVYTSDVGMMSQMYIPLGHYSTVKLELKQLMTSAELNLYQTEVPESETDRTKEGWQRHIFQRIKSTFGYGNQLF